MTRSFIGVSAAVAMVSLGMAAMEERTHQPLDDEPTRKRLEAEREERRRRLEGRQRLREVEEERQRQAAIERARMLSEGLDPTNGRPLSRQQRRQMERNRPKTFQERWDDKHSRWEK